MYAGYAMSTVGKNFPAQKPMLSKNTLCLQHPSLGPLRVESKQTRLLSLKVGTGIQENYIASLRV